MIAFTNVFLDNDNNEVSIVLHYRWKGPLQIFLVPIPTMEPFVLFCLWVIYMVASGIPGEFHGTNEKEYNIMGAKCQVQQVAKERQVWATFVSKKSVFLIDALTAYYLING